MKDHVVLYRDDSISMDDDPYGFLCKADSYGHAAEQCVNAYPGCGIAYVAESADYMEVLEEFNSLMFSTVTDNDYFD